MKGKWDPLGTGIIIFFRAFQASKCEYILESIPGYGKQVYAKSLFTWRWGTLGKWVTHFGGVNRLSI